MEPNFTRVHTVNAPTQQASEHCFHVIYLDKEKKIKEKALFIIGRCTKRRFRTLQRWEVQ